LLAKLKIINHALYQLLLTKIYFEFKGFDNKLVTQKAKNGCRHNFQENAFSGKSTKSKFQSEKSDQN
jgi:hypothetical protein